MSYYKFLCDINKSICKEYKVREDSIVYFPIIEKAINEVIFHSHDKQSILTNSMRVAALIKLFQPFDDGNNRTALIIFSYLLSKKGYTFDDKSALNDMKAKKITFPTIYYEDDPIENLDNWKKYIN